MKNILNISMVMLMIASFTYDASGQNKIKWMTWEEALSANEKEPRKIVVDIYTDWCGWCKRMDKKTFQQDHIATYVNKNYYPVKFDAEMKKDITFNGKTYSFINNGRKGYHELAAVITQGRLSYPTVVFLDEELSVIQPIPGFQDAKTFEMIMTYFAGDYYKSIPWVSYTNSFQSKANAQTVSH